MPGSRFEILIAHPSAGAKLDETGSPSSRVRPVFFTV